MNKATDLLEALEDLTWENYVDIAEKATLVDKNNLDDDLVRHSSIYSYYQGLLSVAKKRLDEANLDLTTYTATTRKEKKSSTIAKQTAKDLDDFVESNDEFRVYTQRANEAAFKYTLLKGLVSSLDHKKDMIVQLSSNRRAETNLYR
jgi:adenine C2-methylase RlmN of 23S rRNA A2503 and tRNA A37|tara:strand:- start:286 stop:726 length:441 start_codon:yes stop_codon:yes gene_type:complete